MENNKPKTNPVVVAPSHQITRIRETINKDGQVIMTRVEEPKKSK